MYIIILLTLVQPSPPGDERRPSDMVLVVVRHTNRNNIWLEHHRLIEPENKSKTTMKFPF